MNLPDPTEVGEMTEAHYFAQNRFVSAFLETNDPVKAARKIGYTGPTPGKKGRAMLEWPGTKALIKEQLDCIKHIARITKQWILHEMMARYEDSVYAENPKYLESAKILEMIRKNAGLDDLDDDGNLDITIRKF